MTAILASPSFLFHAETSTLAEADASGARDLSAYEVASRLSYFLWKSLPDKSLSELAVSGRILDPDVLDAQITRLMADAKFDRFIRGLANQWLLGKFDSFSAAASIYPTWNATLKEDMRTETILTLKEILRSNMPLETLVSGKFTYLNSRLAQHYGIAGTFTNTTFVKTALPENRSGLFTQSAILSQNSGPDRPSPVKRGFWVMDRLLCKAPPPPPADVTSNLPESNEPGSENMSIRDKMALHRSEARCAACHQSIDPIGFGLENYNSIGLWIDRDEHGLTIDSTGDVFGKPFRDVAVLAQIVQEDTRYKQCITRAVMIYASGKEIDIASTAPAESRCEVLRVAEQLVDTKNNFSSLIRAIAQNKSFIRASTQ